MPLMSKNGTNFVDAESDRKDRSMRGWQEVMDGGLSAWGQQHNNMPQCTELELAPACKGDSNKGM